MQNKLAWLTAILLPLIVAIGARLGTIITPILLIISIIAIIYLVTTDKISSRFYPLYLFGITLGLMYSASMVGAHVIGSDMQQEYYVSSQTYLHGWNITGDYGTQSSTSFVVSWLVPNLSKILHVDIAWIYKAVLPFIFSFTPLVLYCAFKKQITEKQAFYSCLFFMFVPVATLEIVQIGKSMVAELFLALMIYFLVAQIKLRYKLPLIVGSLLICILAHYTVGLMALSYLAVIAIVRLFTFPFKVWIFRYVKIPVLALLSACVIGIILTVGFYSYAANGEIMDVVSKIAPGYVKTVKNIGEVPVTVNHPVEEENQASLKPQKVNYMFDQAPLVQAAIGIDFMQSSTVGKIFRIIQYITQILIIIGALYLIFRWKRYNFTTCFIIGIGASFLLMLACIIVPHFSTIINMTRFYQIALFFIAPLLVIGGMEIFKNKWAVPSILVVYFLFTSGLVFEIMQSNTIDKLDVPYSVGLSAERTGVVGTYTQDDVNVARWIRDNGIESYRVVGDYNGYRLMMAFIKQNPRLRTQDEQYAPDLINLPDVPCYIVITSWNTEHYQYITDIKDKWEAAGMRQTMPLPYVYWAYKTDHHPIHFYYPVEKVFQSGDSIVYAKN